MPIIAVNDVGFPINSRNNFKYRSCKECKTFGIVIMAVNSVTFEIILVVKEIVNDAVSLGFKYSAILTAPRNRNGNRSDKLHLVFKFLLDSVIKRHNNTATYKSFAKRYRK